MRRDVFIQNDSGGFSVLAAAAVDAIVADGRQDDVQFVAAHQALLLELYGDDSMPVRLVVDEPLLPQEQAQWLACASWRLDAPDGRLLVMGGFDPDVLSSWQSDHGPDRDAASVAVVEAQPGAWRVEVYAHVGSMNGRAILDEADEKPGARFRREHPGEPFPLWLAQMLSRSSELDPGYEPLWADCSASVSDGSLAVAAEPKSFVGLLVHVTPFSGSLPEPPEGGWFERTAGARVPERFPTGLAANVADADLDGFKETVFGETASTGEPPSAPVDARPPEIIEVWRGEPLKSLGPGPRPRVGVRDAFRLYWLAGLCVESPPLFELWVTAKGAWTPPQATLEYAVAPKGSSVWALGAPADSRGWLLWWAARLACQALAGVPDGSTIDLAMAPRGQGRAGRALFSGTVTGDTWEISEASPAVRAEDLASALAFLRELVEHERIPVAKGAERRALERAVEAYVFEPDGVVTDSDGVRLAEPDERTLLLVAAGVFRARFGHVWPCEEPAD